MLVIACGHFNRVGISVAGTERIIPDYGIASGTDGAGVYGIPDLLHAGHAARRLVHRPFRPANGLAAPGLRFRFVRRLDRLRRIWFFMKRRPLWLGCWWSGRCWAWCMRRCIPGAARMVADELPPRRGRKPTAGSTSRLAWESPRLSFVMGALIDRFDWQVALS